MTNDAKTVNINNTVAEVKRAFGSSGVTERKDGANDKRNKAANGINK